MEKRQLVELAQQGSTAHYEQLVRAYQRLAITWAWSIVKDFHVAQDVVQDSFVIGFRKLNTLRNPAAFPGWLSEIVRRQALQQLRKSDGSLSLDLFAEPSMPEGKEPAWLERHSATIGAIQSLPQHEQDVVVLHYLDGYSATKVADLLGRPVGTVTKQLSRAIRRLQSLLVEVRDESN